MNKITNSSNTSPQFLITLAIAFLFVFSLGACGSSGSGTASSGESGATLSGQITSQGVLLTARQNIPRQSMFARLIDHFKIQSAHAQEVTGDPVSGAIVQLMTDTGIFLDLAITEADGTFSFDGLPAGTYSLLISHPDYPTTTLSGIVVEEGSVTGISGTYTSDGLFLDMMDNPEDPEEPEEPENPEEPTCEVRVDNQAQLGHAEAIADASGVPIDDVIALREEECLGWGEIAHSLGVHPGTLGNGGQRPDQAGPPPHSNGNGGGRPETAGPPSHSNGNGGGNRPGNRR